jgi:hypothetical protein
MKLRLRLQNGPRVAANGRGKNRHVASALAALLWPGVLTAYSLAVWALAAQLRVSGEFAISRGPFSHWQVWLAGAILLNLTAIGLSQYGRTGDLRLPSQLTSWLSGSGSRRA